MIRKATIKDIKAIAAIYEDIHTMAERCLSYGEDCS